MVDGSGGGYHVSVVPRPRVLILSTIENLDIIEGMRLLLQNSFEVLDWTDSPSNYLPIDKTFRGLSRADFAVFVTSTDDSIIARGLPVSPNFIYYLGLCVGRIGLDRCFVANREHATSSIIRSIRSTEAQSIQALPNQLQDSQAELSESPSKYVIKEAFTEAIEALSANDGGSALREKARGTLSQVTFVINNFYGERGNVSMHNDQRGSWVGGDQAGGDIYKPSAGRDLIGSIGRENVTEYTKVSNKFEDVDQFSSALEDLLQEVNVDIGLPVSEKLEALAALTWWKDHLKDEERPADVSAQVGHLRKVGGWVWQKFTNLMAEMPSATVAAWLIEVSKHIAGM